LADLNSFIELRDWKLVLQLKGDLMDLVLAEMKLLMPDHSNITQES
jgi:hypothetical protein